MKIKKLPARAGSRHRREKILVLAVSFLLVCLFLGFGFYSAFAEDGVAAIVNNEVITQKDLKDFINFMRIQMSAQYSKREIEFRINETLPDLINRLIEDRLILQAAYKENIIVDPARIKARLEEMGKRYSTEADFRKALAGQGLTLADIELKVKEQLLTWDMIDRKIKNKIMVTPQEVTDYYYQHNQEYNKSEQRLTRFIMVKDPDLIKKIGKIGHRYKDLDRLGKAYSLQITDLGWVTREQLREEIADIVFDLEIGKISASLDSNENFYIFEIKTTKPPMTRPLFDAQEEISSLLFRLKMQEAMLEWLTELESKAYIEIKADYEAG